MAMQLNAFAHVPVRLRVTNTGGTPIANTNAVEYSVRDILIAAFKQIPNQAGGTATVAAIVTALETLPISST